MFNIAFDPQKKMNLIEKYFTDFKLLLDLSVLKCNLEY